MANDCPSCGFPDAVIQRECPECGMELCEVCDAGVGTVCTSCEEVDDEQAR